MEHAEGSMPAGMVKTIPLESVKLAMVTSKARRILGSATATGKPLSRCAAYSDLPYGGPSCPEAMRGMKPWRNPRATFSVLDRGYLHAVVERTRLERGLPEVRRIWGKGLRAMQAELKSWTVQ